MPGPPEYPVLGGVEYKHPLSPPTSAPPAGGLRIQGTSSLTANVFTTNHLPGVAGTQGFIRRTGPPALLPLPLKLRLTLGTNRTANTPSVRVSQQATEFLVQHVSNARVSQVATEFLVSSHQRNIYPNFAGTSSLSASVTKTSSTTAQANPLRPELHLPGPPHLLPLPLTLKLNRFPDAGAAPSVTRNLILEIDGVGQLRFVPGLADFPVTFAGTSSLVVAIAGGSISVTFAGKSTFLVNLHRKQFTVRFDGRSSLTVGPYDIGPKGGRLSQVTAEVLTQLPAPEADLSQVTVEVLRPRTGGHIWYRR